jgi:hypothetical protein
MALLSRKQQIALKVEGTEGTAVTLGAAGAKMLCYDPSFSADIGLHERNPCRSSLTPLTKIPGRQAAGLSWRTELKGSGVVATRPAWDAALRCCGFTSAAVSTIACGTIAGGPFLPGETITGSSSGGTGRVVGQIDDGDAAISYVPTSGATVFNADDVFTGGTSAATCAASAGPAASKGYEYRPASSGVPSCSAARFKDGMKAKIHGARGNVAIDAKAGEPAFLAFNFEGVYSGVSDKALLSPTYETTSPPAFLNAQSVISGLTAVFTTANLDMQNTLAAREDANATKGIKSVIISARAPRLTLDPEMELVATEDYYGELVAATAGRWYAEIGSTAGNKIVIAVPRTQYGGVDEGDREGIATANLEINCVTNSIDLGDNEVQIAML